MFDFFFQNYTKSTYCIPLSVLPSNFTNAIQNMKLENIVNTPDIPVSKEGRYS